MSFAGPMGMRGPKSKGSAAERAANQKQLKQAENFIKMLDDMRENDPDGYKAFIDETLKKGPPPGMMEGGAEAAAAAVLGGRGLPGGAAATQRGFRPTAGFVLKTTAVDAAGGGAGAGGAPLKVFLNCCSHRGIQKPMDARDQPLKDDAPAYAARQIPLLIGPRHDVEDHSGARAAAFDVLFNPWVIRRAVTDPAFEAQVAELALKWVTDELAAVGGAKLRLSRKWKRIKSRYKGGEGADGRTPRFFPIEVAEQQQAEGEARKAGKPRPR